jgi:hypothetical protein
MMSERLIGVEIEFINKNQAVNCNEVARAINAAGVGCAAEGYNHSTRSYWKVVTDASVKNKNNQPGGELVSPPLKAADMKAQLEVVCRVLSQLGITVNKTCGLHVHHDARDFQVDNFKKLYTMYIRFEDALDTLMPESRRNNNNSYCAGFKSQQQYYFDQIRRCTTVSQIDCLFSNRYVKLNCQSFQRHGTIEFRHHSGTVEFTKIWNWVVLTQGMVQTALNCSVSIPKNAEKMSQKWFDFKKVIKGYKWMGASDELQDAINFYNKRRQELAKEMNLELTA